MVLPSPILAMLSKLLFYPNYYTYLESYQFQSLTITFEYYGNEQLRLSGAHWNLEYRKVPFTSLSFFSGLGFPNFAIYYKVAHVASLPKYHATHEIPLWVAIESVDCDPLSVSNLLWLCPADRTNLRNPVTRHFLSLWDKLKSTYNLQSPHNPLLSFLKNPSFYPAWESPAAFGRWASLGLIRLHNLVTTSTFLPIPTLSESANLPPLELFRHLQMKNFYTPNTNTITPLTNFQVLNLHANRTHRLKGWSHPFIPNS